MDRKMETCRAPTISGSIPAFPTSLFWVYIGIMENEMEAVVIIGLIRGNVPH